jgi:anti-anti-sigma regulatory factor
MLRPGRSNDNPRRVLGSCVQVATLEETTTMPIDVSFIPEEDRLDLSFDGNLDLTNAEALCGLSCRIPSGLRTCILDLTRVERVFDSGVALLQMLCRVIRRVGATVVILGDHPEVKRCLSAVMANALYVSPLDCEPTPPLRTV